LILRLEKRIALMILVACLSFACLSSSNGTLAAPTIIVLNESTKPQNSSAILPSETAFDFQSRETKKPPLITETLTVHNVFPTLSSTEDLDSWTDCSQSSFGTMLLCNGTGKCMDDWIRPIDVLRKANDQYGVKGMAATGAPSEYLRDSAFVNLPGWTRTFLRGTYSSLENLNNAAEIFDMDNMYECFGYGPESAHQAGDEALDPLQWVPKAEMLAENASKCLIYGPAVQDYERLSTPDGESSYREEELSGLIGQVAPHVDIWMIQLAKYQTAADEGRDYDGNPYSIADFENWISNWVAWIKSSNQDTAVWVQLGIGQNVPGQGCQPPQPSEYILEYREILIKAGVDGVFVMPSMPCQYSEDPQDHEYYLQSLATFSEAIQLACEEPISSSIFEDVPLDHPYYREINILYQSNYTDGCSREPLIYCPERGMTRAESAVFMERAIHGVEEIPGDPLTETFSDVSLSEWYAKWVEALWVDGLTAGCRIDPMSFCPLSEHTRAEGAVFSLRLLNGNGYLPVSPIGLFTDVDLEQWYAPWVEAAYNAGLIEACTSSPDLSFCPNEPLTRAVAAYMIVQAMDLEFE
jgi:hypothetical protein